MSSINPIEITRFSRLADDWWNPTGVMQPLHKMNPARLEYIRHAVCDHFGRPSGGMAAFKGLSMLDIGCGAGLLCEPLARLGAAVTGVDASAEGIEAAKAHAKLSGLDIDYLCGSAEGFANPDTPSPLKTKGLPRRANPSFQALSPSRGRGSKYDVITVLEILEHVTDMDSLLQAAAKLLKPNGVMILSTLNRTPKSFLLGIVAAEYLLQWLPRGTHDWRKFIRPSELAAHLDKVGMAVGDITGVIYDPLNDAFVLRHGDVGMNYLMTAVKR